MTDLTPGLYHSRFAAKQEPSEQQEEVVRNIFSPRNFLSLFFSIAVAGASTVAFGSHHDQPDQEDTPLVGYIFAGPMLPKTVYFLVMSSGKIETRSFETFAKNPPVVTKILGQLNQKTLEDLKSWVDQIHPDAEFRELTAEETRRLEMCAHDGGSSTLAFGTQFYKDYGRKSLTGFIGCSVDRRGFTDPTTEANAVKIVELLDNLQKTYR